MYPVIYLVLGILLALWVRKDAINFREKGVDLNPSVWSTLIFLFWMITFPLYLVFRFLKYKKLAKLGNAQLTSVSKVHSWWLVIIFIGVPLVIVLFFLASSMFKAMEESHTAVENTQNNVSNHLGSQTPSNQNTSNSSGSSTSSALKTYTNPVYGFSFEYPSDLSIKQISPQTYGSKTAVDMFNVYDAQYTAPVGATGQTVRSQLRKVQFTVYPYSSKILKSIQSGYMYWTHATNVVNPTITIGVYKSNSKIVGPYFKSIFNNNSYIIAVDSIQHDKLTRQILSTFRFQ